MKKGSHYINYDKKDCRPENLITLCKGCNGKVNFQRGFWLGYFMGKMQLITKNL